MEATAAPEATPAPGSRRTREWENQPITMWCHGQKDGLRLLLTILKQLNDSEISSASDSEIKIEIHKTKDVCVLFIFNA